MSNQPNINEISAAAVALSGCEGIISLRFWKIEPKIISQSLLTTLLISLKDVLTFLDNTDARLVFTDHFDSGDITDAVRNMRDAAYHTTSGKRQVFKNSTSVSFYVAGPGQKLNLISGGRPIPLENTSLDDIAFFTVALGST